MTDTEFIKMMVGTPYCMKNERGVNCWGLISEYYRLQGITLFNYVLNTLNPRDLNMVFTVALTEGYHGFTKTDKPKNGDVVLFNHPLHYHCGLWLDGKILHSTNGVGVIYQPMKDISGFHGYEYWTKK